MVRSLLLTAAVAALATAAPTQSKRQGWDTWDNWFCTAETKSTRVAFGSMPPAERKAYSDAINCIHSAPSNLDQTLYSAAVNRYQDYAVVHTNRTGQVHLSGFFLTWHRYFLHLFEEDLRSTCGYKGRFPYWDFADTAGHLETSAEFDGSEYSLGSNGAPMGSDPIALGPQLVIPHGSGGGCIQSGPFSDWTATLGFIDPLFLIAGTPLPPNTYDYNASCLIRDLNDYVSTTYTNITEVITTSHSPSAMALELNVNGKLGSSSLGVHSAAHFNIGGFMNSIHVSVQDPIWWALHTNLDRIYTSWQINNPSVANTLYGTMTANNAPPSANVTIDDIEPTWGYFDESSIPVKDLLSTTAGPFCYGYDKYVS